MFMQNFIELSATVYECTRFRTTLDFDRCELLHLRKLRACIKYRNEY